MLYLYLRVLVISMRLKTSHSRSYRAKKTRKKCVLLDIQFLRVIQLIAIRTLNAGPFSRVKF